MKEHRRVLNRIVSEPWAITRPALEEILSIAQRQNLSPDAVAAELGRDLDNTFTVTARDGVAVVPVRGPMFRYASFFSRISGATSYEELAIDFFTVLDDPNIRAVLFDVDSPGGQMNGASELAKMIFAARGRKPMAAYVGGAGASAAYWLASAVGDIVAADTAMLGSIGVIAAFLDTKEAERKAGLLTIEIVSSQSPRKNPDPAAEDGRSQIQRMIDDLGEVFVRAVARNRGVDRDAVLAEDGFGAGDVLVGARAVEVGLADRIGSFESVLADLAERGRAQAELSAGGITVTTVRGSAMPTETQAAATTEQQPAPAAAPTINRAFLDANHADLVAQIRTEGATAERERILGIEAIALEGHDELVAEMKKDPTVSREAAGLRILAAEKASGAAAARRHLTAVEDDEAALEGGPKPAAVRKPQGGEKPSEDALVARLVTAGRPQKPARA